jgi:hypothetical protein
MIQLLKEAQGLSSPAVALPFQPPRPAFIRCRNSTRISSNKCAAAAASKYERGRSLSHALHAHIHAVPPPVNCILASFSSSFKNVLLAVARPRILIRNTGRCRAAAGLRNRRLTHIPTRSHGPQDLHPARLRLLPPNTPPPVHHVPG